MNDYNLCYTGNAKKVFSLHQCGLSGTLEEDRRSFLPKKVIMPALSTISLFLLAALGLLLIPGPSVLYIITRSVAQGRSEERRVGKECIYRSAWYYFNE